MRLRQAARHTPPTARPPRPCAEDLEALLFSKECVKLTIRKNATVSNDHAEENRADRRKDLNLRRAR
jgi:hypothetical protein